MRPTNKMLSRPVPAQKEAPGQDAAAAADPRAEAMKARRDALEKRLTVLKGMKASGNLLGTIRSFGVAVERLGDTPPPAGPRQESTSRATHWKEAVGQAAVRLQELEKKLAERMDKRIAGLAAEVRGIDGAIEAYKKRRRAPVLSGQK